jgi:probable phosphoglycerate mutase
MPVSTRPHAARPTGSRTASRVTTVILVRHGRTPTTGTLLPGRAPGLHLAEEGVRQAAAVGERIGRLTGVSAVYTSPLERARETAQPIARARGVAARVNPALSDVDVGEWTGLALADLRRRPEWRQVQQYPSGFRFPGGESFVEAQARMTTALARVVEQHRGTAVVVVSHADAIKLAVAHALGMPLDLFQRIEIAPASVTVIAYRPERPVVLAVNTAGGDLAALGLT